MESIASGKQDSVSEHILTWTREKDQMLDVVFFWISLLDAPYLSGLFSEQFVPRSIIFIDTFSMEGRLDGDVSIPDVLKVQKNKSGLASIRQPQKIGHFCCLKLADGSRQFVDDGRELKVLKLPRDTNSTSFNLKEGYIPISSGGPVIGISSESGLKEILEYLIAHQEKFKLANPDPSQRSTPFNTDFITYRGVLAQIMRIPYENQEDVLIGATLFKGTIYMYSFTTDARRAQEDNKDEHGNACSYGGHRFEEYITDYVDTEVEKQETPYGRNQEFCLAIRTRVGQHSVAYGAEMDCVKTNVGLTTANLSDFVEIKTTKAMKHPRQYQSLYRYKTIKWWTQSYLAGTPTIVCGHRDDNLIVRWIELFEVNDLPKMSQEFWNHKVCINFLNDFLTHVKNVVSEDDPKLVYKFYWKPNINSSDNVVTCTKTRDPKFRVVPDWFVEKLA